MRSSGLFRRIMTRKDGTDRLTRKSVRNFHCSLRNNSDESSSNLLRGGSLKSSYWWLQIGLLLLFCIIVLPRNGEQKSDTWQRERDIASLHLDLSFTDFNKSWQQWRCSC
jgi:hypothetical protein